MVDSRTREQRPSAEAVEFVRFCYRRRRIGWPELYDEMCAVASRGLYRGWGTDELSAEGIGFGLYQLPILAALVSRVVAEEREHRVPATLATVARALEDPDAVDVGSVTTTVDIRERPNSERPNTEDVRPHAPLRLAGAPAGA